MCLIPIIIPAYEPDDKLISLIDKLEEANLNQPVIVVNDGSSEDTRVYFKEIEDRANISVLHHAVNMGKGRALKTAFNEALNKYPDLLGCITIDSDGQHRVEDMISCMEALKKSPDSLVLGVRDFNRDDVPARSAFGNKMTSRVMKTFAGMSISDTQTGLRAIPGEYIKHLLTEKGERYEFETNMLLETKEQGVPIVEVPIETIYLEENKSSHFNPLKDSLKIYTMFFKFIFSSLSSSVIDIALFQILCVILQDVNFGSLGYIFVATVIARVLSSIYNFAYNYRTVFKSKGSLLSSIIRYSILAVVIMVVSGIAVERLHAIFPVVELAIKIPVDTLLFLVSFYVQREFVYKS